MHLGEIAIGYRRHGIIDTPNSCRTQPDRLDRTHTLPVCGRVLAVATEVSDTHGLVGEQIEAADEVFDRVLCCERNGYTAHTETCDKAVQRDTELVADVEDNSNHSHDPDDACSEAQQVGIQAFIRYFRGGDNSIGQRQ